MDMDSTDRGILTSLELRSRFGRQVYILFLVVLILIAAIVLFPFLFAFTSGLKNSTEIFNSGLRIFPIDPQWQNYPDVWTKFGMPQLFLNSFIIVTGALACMLTVTTLAAYSLARLKPLGGKI